MSYEIHKGKIPGARPRKRTKLDQLITLAKEMQVGDSVHLPYSEAQTFRVIVATLGFDCITDGWQSQVKGQTLVFKVDRQLKL